MTLFYEDMIVGTKFTSSYTSLDQQDINEFAELTKDFNPIHIDRDFARSTIFRTRIAHGLLVLSTALGLWYQMGLTRDSLVALVGISDIAFRAPVRPGDHFRLVSEVASRRPSKSRPDSGIVTLRDNVVSEDGRAFLGSKRVLLLKRSGRGSLKL